MSSSVAAPPYSPSAVWTIQQTAAYLNVHPRMVARLPIPRAINTNKVVRYRAVDVEKYLRKPKPPKPKRKASKRARRS